ncbi:hypothetical protein BCR36DRAFT_407364 [Piromyces finnis]|uniref:Uncharacterized protein n=1 Tax=Piromyces finnis TaxID=1754191 RepID=A0A1Y1UW90_9FUNG|nr:hypothetical protein BCR36DRAFT_407364 [Piromyces finnis]|eukprot:ORX41748.1 hypothetical protein BCR36DRAFT_407364 [Piromyces finnis]
MKFDNSYSSIRKELKNVQIDKTIEPYNYHKNNNKKVNDIIKCSITEKENDFINKAGIPIKKFINKIEEKKNINNGNWEHVPKNKIDISIFENPRELHNRNDTLYYPFNSYEELNNSETKRYLSSENLIELKTFKKNIEKRNNEDDDNKFNISNVDIDENIFSNNTYSENYINENEYFSDSSSEYLSSSPFKYDNVTGIKIPSPKNNTIIYDKIASPQPESKFNIGSTIASFNEIADFIYETESKRKDLDEDEFFNSGNNNSIKKNDTFIKNYLNHTRNNHSRKKDYHYDNNYNNNYNYITFKSLSNKKVNSNDVIDRGCLFSKVDPDEYYENNNNIKKSFENETTETNFYSYNNVFELDDIKNKHELLLDNYFSKEYILTESDNSEEEIEELTNIKKEKYYKDNIELCKQNIYDECIFNI